LKKSDFYLAIWLSGSGVARETHIILMPMLEMRC